MLRESLAHTETMTEICSPVFDPKLTRFAASQELRLLLVGRSTEWAKRLTLSAELVGFSVQQVSSPSLALALIADTDPVVMILDEIGGELTVEDMCDALRIPRQVRPLGLFVTDGQALPAAAVEEWGIDGYVRRDLVDDRLLEMLVQLARVTWLQRRILDRENEILDWMPHALLEVDAATVVWKANLAVAELLGLPRDSFRKSILGKPLDTAFAGSANGTPSFVDGLRQAITHGKEKYRGRERIGGEERVLSANITPLQQNGEHFLVELRDVTEEERALMMEAQRERLATIGNLAVGAAHEIQNPNTFSRVNAENLRQLFGALKPVIDASLKLSQGKIGTLPLSRVYEKIEESIEGVEKASRRIEAVLTTLKTFGRTTGEKIGGTDPRKAIDEALMLTAHELKGKVQLKVDLPAQLPQVQGADAELSQVFVNLISNAVLAFELPGKQERGDAAPLIRIHVDRSTLQELTIAVTDNGPGISEETQKKIFRPYFTTRPQGSGTGLGLSISSDILHRFDGHLSVESRPGRGASFLVTLKRVDLNEAKTHSGA